jgi:hypothetical protein
MRDLMLGYGLVASGFNVRLGRGVIQMIKYIILCLVLTGCSVEVSSRQKAEDITPIVDRWRYNIYKEVLEDGTVCYVVPGNGGIAVDCL